MQPVWARLGRPPQMAPVARAQESLWKELSPIRASHFCQLWCLVWPGQQAQQEMQGQEKPVPGWQVQPSGSRLLGEGLACAGSGAPDRRSTTVAAIPVAYTYSFPGRLLCGTPKDTSLGDLKMPKDVTFHMRNAFFLRKLPAVTMAGTTDHLHPPILQANRTQILFRVGPSLIPGTNHNRSPCSPVSYWFSGEM